MRVNDSNRKLIIFDSDGVLVDSEPISNAVMHRMVNEVGWALSLEESRVRFTGRSQPSCIKDIEEFLGLKLTEEFSKNFDQETYRAFKIQLKAVNGIEQVLSSLNSINSEFCCASSGSHEKLRTTLGITGLYPIFKDKIFSAEEVNRGKPFPDLFLYAAKKMGFLPEQCIVIEDSIPGVKAALEAKMKVLGYSERTPEIDLKNAGAITFPSMDKLIKLIQQI